MDGRLGALVPTQVKVGGIAATPAFGVRVSDAFIIGDPGHHHQLKLSIRFNTAPWLDPSSFLRRVKL